MHHFVLNGLGISVWVTCQSVTSPRGSWYFTEHSILQQTSFWLGAMNQQARHSPTLYADPECMATFTLRHQSPARGCQQQGTPTLSSSLSEEYFLIWGHTSETYPREHVPSQNGLMLSLTSNIPEGGPSGGRSILQRAAFPREQEQLVLDGESCCIPRCEGKAELCICRTVQFCRQTHAASL